MYSAARIHDNQSSLGSYRVENWILADNVRVLVLVPIPRIASEFVGANRELKVGVVHSQLIYEQHKGNLPIAIDVKLGRYLGPRKFVLWGVSGHRVLDGPRLLPVERLALVIVVKNAADVRVKDQGG